MFSVTCRILERILGLFELEFFRRLAHRIRLETSKTGSIVLDRTRIPPRGSEEKMDGNEIDGWMDRLEGRRRKHDCEEGDGGGAVGRSSIDL